MTALPRPSNKQPDRRRGLGALVQGASGSGASVLARAREVAASRTARRSAARRVAASTVAVCVLAVTAAGTRQADALRQRWDATAPVLVARHDMDVGDVVSGNSWQPEKRPEAMVPSSALDGPPPPQTVVTEQILAGEPLVAERLSLPGQPTNTVPAGRVAIDLHLAANPAGIDAGDHVDVLTPGSEPTVGIDTAPEAVVVATDAIVLSESAPETAEVLTVAVTEEDLSATAAAALGGSVLVVERNPGG